ncbi:hypothetical protein [Microbacterium testaceum]|uniref:hypothetical protein n=1 Tax=Microbacterium testaceum TaxID=2033 RepID=UPI002AC550CC|nr:hypothetical protein [Microbacterium testaceum]MDZ5146280.1 hypothetical protein [Microbacterium testaceum]
MRHRNARERLAAALLPGEVPLVTVVADTSPATSEGVLAVTPTRVVYTAKNDSWAMELHRVTSVFCEQEYSRGLIRIESPETRHFTADASDAQRVVAALRAGRP